MWQSPDIHLPSFNDRKSPLFTVLTRDPQMETHWQWMARADSQTHLQSLVWLRPQTHDRNWKWRISGSSMKWRFCYKNRWIDAGKSLNRFIPVDQAPLVHHSPLVQPLLWWPVPCKRQQALWRGNLRHPQLKPLLHTLDSCSEPFLLLWWKSLRGSFSALRHVEPGDTKELTLLESPLVTEGQELMAFHPPPRILQDY